MSLEVKITTGDLPCIWGLKWPTSSFPGHCLLFLDTYSQGCPTWKSHQEQFTHPCGCGLQAFTAREVALTGLEGSLRVWNEQQLLDVSLDRRKENHKMILALVSQHISAPLLPRSRGASHPDCPKVGKACGLHTCHSEKQRAHQPHDTMAENTASVLVNLVNS